MLLRKNTTVAVFRKSESRKVSVELGRRPLYVVNVALYSIFNAALARMLSHHRPVHQHTTQCFCYTHTRCQCQRDDLYSTLTISPPNAPSASGVANLEWVRLGSPPLHALHTLLLCHCWECQYHANSVLSRRQKAASVEFGQGPEDCSRQTNQQ